MANASEVDPKTVAKPLYPKQFTIKRKDGKQGGYSDTLIGTLVQLVSSSLEEGNGAQPDGVRLMGSGWFRRIEIEWCTASRAGLACGGAVKLKFWS